MLDFQTNGAALHKGAALSALVALDAFARRQPSGHAGIRLHQMAGLKELLASDTPIGRLAMGYAGHDARPVRAILFDKSAEANWSLSWHQDRTIAVKVRRDIPGFGPWTIKSGLQHVEPPFDIIAQIRTLRIHLDPVPADNAPLLIALGSHRMGRILEDSIDEVVERCGTHVCLADAGDIWVYATPILHASTASSRPARRVLQVDFTSQALPGGLEWLGV